jgi:hypothetical protein
MQLVFLLVFVLFILLNIVLGLVASRKKRRKAERTEPSQDAPEAGYGEADSTAPVTAAIPGYDRKTGDTDGSSFIEAQTTGSIIESMEYEQPTSPEQRAESVDETAPLPGMHKAGSRTPEEIPSVRAALADQSAKIYPARVQELRREYQQRRDRPKTLVDLSALTSLGKERAGEERIQYEDRERKEEGGMKTPPASEVGRSVWDAVNRLPFLKRAVVLSEILGPPKAASKHSHTY